MTDGLGSEFMRALDASLALIQSHPTAHPVLHRDARCAVLRRFPYKIIYVVGDGVIQIIACYHTARDPGDLTQRIDHQ